MKDAVMQAVEKTDVLIMAAAVADYQPKTVAKEKIKKTAGSMNIELTRTPDILSEAMGKFIRVGFAAESEDVVKNAAKNYKGKALILSWLMISLRNLAASEQTPTR